MAKSSYGFERLQRDKEKAAKADAKQQKRQEKKAASRLPEHSETGETTQVGSASPTEN